VQSLLALGRVASSIKGGSLVLTIPAVSTNPLERKRPMRWNARTLFFLAVLLLLLTLWPVAAN
jgi:hypothetical protein